VARLVYKFGVAKDVSEGSIIWSGHNSPPPFPQNSGQLSIVSDNAQDDSEVRIDGLVEGDGKYFEFQHVVKMNGITPVVPEELDKAFRAFGLRRLTIPTTEGNISATIDSLLVSEIGVGAGVSSTATFSSSSDSVCYVVMFDLSLVSFANQDIHVKLQSFLRTFNGAWFAGFPFFLSTGNLNNLARLPEPGFKIPPEADVKIEVLSVEAQGTPNADVLGVFVVRKEEFITVNF